MSQPDDLSKTSLGDYVLLREIGRGGMGIALIESK